MRFLLGNVELLLVPEMDLSHPGRDILANFRNASAGLWRLHPVRAGTVHLEGLFLAQRTPACPGQVTSPILIFGRHGRAERPGQRKSHEWPIPKQHRLGKIALWLATGLQPDYSGHFALGAARGHSVSSLTV